MREHSKADGERAAGRRGFAGQIAAEERLADDRERERVHLAADVDRLAALDGGAQRSSRSVAQRIIVWAKPAMRSRWNAGCASRRWRRQKSPSLVKSPSPRSAFTRPMIGPFV
jgi:hypothetical protein